MTLERDNAGPSSTRFDIPDPRKVIIGGVSHGADPHHWVRLIRIEVRE